MFSVSASFGGDVGHLPSSGRVSVAVQNPSSTSVVCGPSPVGAGLPAMCVVTVSDTAGSPVTPTGVIQFSSPAGSGAFSNSGQCFLAAGSSVGTASCQLMFTPTAPGSYALSGEYSGDSVHTGSSGAFTLAVSRATSTAVSCASVSGSEQCTATVTDLSPAPTTPGGLVTFQVKPGVTYSLAGSSCTLAATGTTGVASCTVPFIASHGTYSVLAGYGGDGTHLGSATSIKLTL
jgi:hypothetical protein